MVSVNPNGTASTVAPSSAAPMPDVAGRGSALASDFDTFLKMLTVQARNQDPLNPLDATDYATQLATFSNVEQQVMTNDLLADISAAVSGSRLDTLRAWVGAQVLSEAPSRYDGGDVAIRTVPSEVATSADLVVSDAAGQEIFRGLVDPTAATVTWDGSRTDGRAAGTGPFSFAVEGFAGTEALPSQPAAVYGRVAEARFDEGGRTVLTLESGAEVSEDDVMGMRIGK